MLEAVHRDTSIASCCKETGITTSTIVHIPTHKVKVQNSSFYFANEAIFMQLGFLELKDPCHAFPVIIRPLVCYESFYACKRSAESKTLKVHPVGQGYSTQIQRGPVRENLPMQRSGTSTFLTCFMN